MVWQLWRRSGKWIYLLSPSTNPKELHAYSGKRVGTFQWLMTFSSTILIRGLSEKGMTCVLPRSFEINSITFMSFFISFFFFTLRYTGCFLSVRGLKGGVRKQGLCSSYEHREHPVPSSFNMEWRLKNQKEIKSETEVIQLITKDRERKISPYPYDPSLCTKVYRR